MPNPLVILTSHDGAGGNTGLPGPPHREWIPVVESDGLRCIKILDLDTSVTGSGYFQIQGDGAGLYRLRIPGTDGDYTAVTLGAVTRLEAGDCWADIITTKAAHAAGAIVGRTNRPVDLPERSDDANGDPRYELFWLYAKETLTVNTITSNITQYYWVSAVTNAAREALDGETEPAEITTWLNGENTVTISMAAGEYVALWLRLDWDGGTNGFVSQPFAIAYTVGATAHTTTLTRSWYQFYEDAGQSYYLAVNSSGGSVPNEDPEGPFESLPFDLDITALLPADIMFGVFLADSKTRLTGPPFLARKLKVSAGGVDLVVPPSVSTARAYEAGGGMVRVEATWTPTVAWPSLDTWRVGVKNVGGFAPDAYYEYNPGAPSPDGKYRLSENVGPLSWGKYNIFGVYIKSGGKWVANKDSVFFNMEPTPGAPYSTLEFPCIIWSVADIGGFDAHMGGGDSRTVIRQDVDTQTDYVLAMAAGMTSAAIPEGDMLFASWANTAHVGTNFHGRGIVTGTVTGSGTAPIVKDGSDYYLCAGGNRVVKITSTTVTAAAFGVLGYHCPMPGPYVEMPNLIDATIAQGSVYWQVYDTTLGKWQTAFRVDPDGTVMIGKGIFQ